MTIKYLVTGREGVNYSHGSESSAITKTYGFKKIEDICKDWLMTGEEVKDEKRVEVIKDKFNQDCIRADIDGEDDWEDDDYQAAYDEAGAWNCVDLILKIDFKSETITTIYESAWNND